MSDTYYNWNADNPPRPDVYVTHRGSNYQSLRYWDGANWFTITESPTKIPVKWSKDSITPQPKRTWYTRSKKLNKSRWFLLRINDKKKIYWGDPFKHYTADEVLRFLVHSKVLPFDWKEYYQHKMRDIDFK